MPDVPIAENPSRVHLDLAEERRLEPASVSPSPPLPSPGGGEIPVPPTPARRLARILNPVDFPGLVRPAEDPKVIVAFPAPAPSPAVEPADVQMVLFQSATPPREGLMESTPTPPVEEIRQQKQLLEEELGALRRQFEAFSAEQERERQRIRDESTLERTELERVRSELSEANRNLALRQENYRGLEKELESLRARQNDSQLRLQEVEVSLTEGYERHANLRSELANWEVLTKQASSEGERARIEIEKAREALRQVREDHSSTLAGLQSIRAEVNDKRNELVSLEGELEGARSRQGVLQDQIQQITRETGERQSELSKLRESVSGAENQLRDMAQAVGQRTSEAEQVRREMDRGWAEVAEAEAMLKQIAEGVATLQRKERSIVEYVQMLNREKRQLERELQRQSPDLES